MSKRGGFQTNTTTYIDVTTKAKGEKLNFFLTLRKKKYRKLEKILLSNSNCDPTINFSHFPTVFRCVCYFYGCLWELLNCMEKRENTSPIETVGSEAIYGRH